MANIIKFEVGAMYWDTSAVDHTDVMTIKITRRTEKSVWFVRMRGNEPEGEPARTKIFTNNSHEYIMPYRYSMAPVWDADRKVEPEAAEQPAPETETPDAPANDATEMAEQATAKTYAVSFIVDGIAQANMAIAESAEAVEAYYNREYSGRGEVCAVREAAEWEIEENRRRGMPFVEVPADDNKAAAMTAQEVTARKLYARAHELRNRAEGLNYEGKLDDSFVRSIERLEVAAYRAAAHESAMRAAAKNPRVAAAMERLRAKQAATDGREAKDSAEANAPDPDDEVYGRMETVRGMGELLNKLLDKGNAEFAHGVKLDIERTLSVDEEYGVALEVEYDADGRFVDVRERKPQAAAETEPEPKARMKFGELPERIQGKVKEYLRAYDDCSVTYERGAYRVSVGVGITARYAPDFKVCGRYAAGDIFTPEQAEAPAETTKSRKAKAPKQYTIRVTRDRTGRTHDHTGTLEELTERFSYTLEKGKSWERERGNRKINLTPKTARSLVTNLQNASDNAAANGYSGVYYELVTA